MKNLKKIGALLLALMMVLGMATVAMAGSLGQDTGTSVPETGVYEGNDTTLTIKKAVVVENDLNEAITVRFPGVTYKFSANKADASADPGAILAGKSVTDGTVTSAVKNGVPAAITIGDAVIAAQDVTLNASLTGATKGQEIVTGDATVTITPAKFNTYGPGIYRYKITENSINGAALYAAGIVRGASVDEEYFLDVYIGWQDDDNNASTPDTLQVLGYVLLSESTETITDTNNPTQNGKESGFDDVTTTVTSENKTVLNAPVTDYTTVDLYHTYNVTLKKTVTGTMGDTTHEFPFEVTVVGNDSNKYIVRDSDDTTSVLTYNSTQSTGITSATLSNGDTVTVIGLSPRATVAYKEQNDTESVYTVTAVDANSDNVTLTYTTDNTVAKTETAATTAANVTNYTSAVDHTTAKVSSTALAQQNPASVTYTNNLETISPTGVVLRFAPYAAMLGATPLFVLLGKKRKEEEDEE